MTTILIDPGHGGQDPGVVHQLVPLSDTFELVEKFITLTMARKLRQSLLGLNWPIAVELTREDDEDLSLHARGELGKKYDADLVISLHVNSAPEPETSGMITFARDSDPMGQSVAKVIASQAPVEVRRRINHYFECNPVEIKNDEQKAWLSRVSNVLEPHRPRSAVCVEMAHMTNAQDRVELANSKVQQGIVVACVLGVEHYLTMLGVDRPAGGRPLLS